MKRSGLLRCMALAVCMVFMMQAVTWAAAEGGGYLSAYQGSAAQPVQSSGWSMAAYLLSLLVVFAFVAFLAYFASKFIGKKFSVAQVGKVSKVLDSMSLGPNRSLYVVEIAGKVLLLGVTEQNITLLEEITDELEIVKLRNEAGAHAQNPDFQQVFAKQLTSLNSLSKKIPSLLNDRKDRK